MDARTLGMCSSVALAFFGAVDDADACSPPLPVCQLYVVQTDDVPANIPGFWWRSHYFTVDPSAVTLTRQEDGGGLVPVPVTVDVDQQWVHPAAELSPGQYVLTIGGACFGSEPGASESFATTISVAPPAALPDSLGPLVASPVTRAPLAVSTWSGACTVDLDAVSVAVEVAPTALAGPWGPMLTYRAKVDGADWFYSDSLAPNFKDWKSLPSTTLFHACEDPAVKRTSAGLAAGRHVIVLEGQIPGTDTWIASDPVTVDLQCSPETSGCAVGPSSRGGWVLALLLAVLGFARGSWRSPPRGAPASMLRKDIDAKSLGPHRPRHERATKNLLS